MDAHQYCNMQIIAYISCAYQLKILPKLFNTNCEHCQQTVVKNNNKIDRKWKFNYSCCY